MERENGNQEEAVSFVQNTGTPEGAVTRTKKLSQYSIRVPI